MTRKLLVCSAVLAVGLCVIVGCEQADDPVDVWHADASFVRSLQERALELATVELKSMAAAEKQYKNVVAHYVMLGHPVLPGTTHFYKWYRAYSHAEVRDIYRSNSLIHPVVYEVDYYFEFMRTPIRSTLDHYGKPASIPRTEAQGDTEFENMGRFAVRRRYKADAYGNVKTEFDPVASRESFPDVGRRILVEGAAPWDSPGMHEVFAEDLMKGIDPHSVGGSSSGAPGKP